MKHGIIASYLILPIELTSNPNIVPAIGVPNTTPKPLLTPLVIIIVKSNLFKFSISPILAQILVPICTPVPSRPADPPHKCVIKVQKNTKGSILNGICPLASFILSIIKLFHFDASFPYLEYK